MDYERIEKRSSHQGNAGALSPGKLRSMLSGVEDKIKKKKYQDQEHETAYSLRPPVSQIDYSGGCFYEDCKDVDVISVQPECTASTTSHSYIEDMVSDSKLSDNSLGMATFKSQDNCYLDYDGGHDNMNTPLPMFEFQKMDRVPPRGPLASLSKPAPSKWDDAQKWIASPASDRTKGGHSQGYAGSRKTRGFGYGSRQLVTKVVVEVPDQRLVPYEEPDTERIDCSQANSKNGCNVVDWDANMHPMPYTYGKDVVVLDNCVAEPAINLSRHVLHVPVHSETTLVTPPSTARSVSMRDMGTEMTPIVSQEPSRNGTPVRATTPARSPSTSRSSTPQRTVPSSSLIGPLGNNTDLNHELSEKELQMKTRREIMALGTQLGKTNIAAWASNEAEENDVQSEQAAKGFTEVRAAAWEEAEKAKYMASFKREEMKIQAWENHQKAKAEAEMRKMEVKVERMRSRAHSQLMNKLAAMKHKAEEKLAAADAKRRQQAAETEQQAECIRSSGRAPSFQCCSCCL